MGDTQLKKKKINIINGIQKKQKYWLSYLWKELSVDSVILVLTMENKILPVLNERLGCQKTYTKYQSRIKYLKVQYQIYLDLQRNSSGFGWDSETKKFTASKEAHPNHKYMRYDSHDMFEDLQIVFDGATANDSKSVGLGDTTDAPTCRVGDDQVKETLVFCESGDDGHVEKFIPRKRSRTKACNNLKELKSDNNDSVVTMSNKIISIIQQREERQQKEAERREAEKKKNSVWTKDETDRFLLSRTVEYLHVVISYHGKCP
ncbi:unnamed protein product, partial [Thlaspi arvense]